MLSRVTPGGSGTLPTRCEKLATGALGVLSTPGAKPVPGVLPGEEVEILPGGAVERLSSSPIRIEPTCPYAGRCGGCDFDYVSAEDSAGLKQQIVEDNLRSRGGTEYPIPFLPAAHGPGEGWRGRCRVHVSLKGRKVGFLAKRSNEIVEVGRCPRLTEALNAYLANPGEIFRRGQSHLFSRGVNRKTGFVELPLFEADGGRVLIGAEEGVRTIAGTPFHLSGEVFFQSNPGLLPELFSFVTSNTEGEEVMDLFAGVATFSALFEGSGRRLTAVERDKNCLRYARRNAPSAEFFTNDVSLWAKKARRHVDTVIVDPPRPGVGRDAMEMIASWKPGRIIYVSCNSASLASDIRGLQGYRITKARVFDFYPGSGHEESALLLERE